MMLDLPRKLFVVSMCVSCSSAWAQTTEPARRTLTFEKGALWENHWFDIPDAATFVTTFVVAGDTCLGGMPPAGKSEVLLGQVLREIAARADQFQFSPELRDLLTEPRNAGKNNYPFFVRSDPAAGGLVFYCFAANEEDARRMAGALLDCIDAARRAHYDVVRRRLEESETTIAVRPEQIAKMKKDREEALQAIDALTKIVPVTKWGEGGAGDYQVELQKLLRSVNIDVAAIQAKMSAIKKLRNTASGSLALHLDQMQATQDVELAGAMVRKSMVEIDLKNTTDYSEAMTRQLKLDDSVRSLEKQLEQVRKDLPSLQKIMKDAKRNRLLEPVQLVRPIQVCPVKKTAETSNAPSTSEAQ